MKFSIITPAYKAERWISETIESVLSQEGNFEIEYIVVVDTSDDRTEAIAREYEERVRSGGYPVRANRVTMEVIVPEARNGMYAAMNLGFARATGDIHAWMPADDLYEAGAFEAAQKVFTAFPDSEWIKGTTSVVDANGALVYPGSCQMFHTPWIRAGVYGMEAYHVDQASVFWRAPLWKQAGVFPPQFKVMGDYWLWTSFAKHTRLWTFDTPISKYRKHPEQGSAVFAKECKRQMWEARGNKRPLAAWMPRFYFHPYYHFIPSAWKPLWERLYPIFFPRHSREYITLRSGTPEKDTLRTFVSSL